MPVPSTITDLSDTAASNFPQSTDACGSTLADLPRAIQAIIKKQFISGTDVTVLSSGSVTLPTENSYVTIQGTGFNITAFANCYNGREITLRFASAGLVLVHSAGLQLPGAANITTGVNDVAIFVNESSGVWRCASYLKADGTAIVSPSTLQVKAGIITKNMTDASGTQVVSGLGFTPKKISFSLSRETGSGVLIGNGAYDGTTNNSIVNLLSNGYSTPPEQYSSVTTSTSYCINAYDTPYAEGQRASVTATAAGQFTLTWTKTGTPTGTSYIIWEAIG